MILPCLTANYFPDVQQIVGLQCSSKQENLQLVVSVLPQRCWWAAFPACSKTQVKGGITSLNPRLPCLRDAFSVSCPGHKCSSDTEMQLCKCFPYAEQTGSNYKSHCLNQNWWAKTWDGELFYLFYFLLTAFTSTSVRLGIFCSKVI